MHKIKVGDVVHARHTIAWTDGLHYEFTDVEGDLRKFLCVADIVHVEPRPLQVGDAVKCREREVGIGRVVHIIADIDKAWVHYPNVLAGLDCVEAFSRLARA